MRKFWNPITEFKIKQRVPVQIALKQEGANYCAVLGTCACPMVTI